MVSILLSANPQSPQVRFERPHWWGSMAAALTLIQAATVAPCSALPSRSRSTASLVVRCARIMARENHDTSIYRAGEEPKAGSVRRADFGEFGAAVTTFRGRHSSGSGPFSWRVSLVRLRCWPPPVKGRSRHARRACWRASESCGGKKKTPRVWAHRAVTGKRDRAYADTRLEGVSWWAKISIRGVGKVFIFYLFFLFLFQSIFLLFESQFKFQFKFKLGGSSFTSYICAIKSTKFWRYLFIYIIYIFISLLFFLFSNPNFNLGFNPTSSHYHIIFILIIFI